MRRRALLLALAGAAIAVVPAGAQSLAERASRMGSGTILLAFPARDGVCGNGRGGIRIFRRGAPRFAGDPVWEPDCAPGPVRVAARVRAGRVVDLETNVGGRWRNAGEAQDLGTLEPTAAARLLLEFARAAPEDPGEDAILPAALARGVEPWEELLAIARDGRVPAGTREVAASWLGRAAGERMAHEVETLAGDEVVDLRVREAALHSLSELDDADAGVTALLRIARAAPDPRIRERALFWLAETGDPRALALFEEILRR